MKTRTIASRPRFNGFLPLAPVECYLQLRPAIQRFLLLAVLVVIAVRRVSQSPIDLRRLRLFLHPLSQLVPVSNQAFVGDVDRRFIIQFYVLTRSQEGALWFAEGIDDGNDICQVGPCHRTDLPQLRGPSDGPIVGSLLGQTGEDFAGQFLMVSR